MKTINYLKFLFIISCSSSLISAQSIIVKNNIDNSISRSNIILEKPLSTDRVTMSQGFALSTSMNNGLSQSFGIYSNQTQFKISEKFQIKTDINLIQGQNLISSTSSQTDLQYGIGFEYKLNPHSIFTFQIINQGSHITKNNMIFPSKVYN